MALKWNAGSEESLSRAPFRAAFIVARGFANVASRVMIDEAAIDCARIREGRPHGRECMAAGLFACNP